MPVDEVPGRGQQWCVQRHDVARGREGVEVDGGHPERGGLRGVEVRVADEHPHVVVAQPLDDGSSDAGRSDDADGDAVHADDRPGPLDVDGSAVGRGEGGRRRERALRCQDDHRDRELGDGDGVGGRGRRDDDVPGPDVVVDHGLHGPGGVGDRPQPGHPVESADVEHRAPPPGDDALDVGEQARVARVVGVERAVVHEPDGRRGVQGRDVRGSEHPLERRSGQDEGDRDGSAVGAVVGGGRAGCDGA